jgi:hypothetical protein
MPAFPHRPYNWLTSYEKADRPSFYESIIPVIRRVARNCGYAIGVHGSLRRDLDLIAAPWIDGCSSPWHLCYSIQMKLLGFVIERRKPTKKPHGRIAYSIHCGWSDIYIDLSIFPIRRKKCVIRP